MPVTDGYDFITKAFIALILQIVFVKGGDTLFPSNKKNGLKEILLATIFFFITFTSITFLDPFYSFIILFLGAVLWGIGLGRLPLHSMIYSSFFFFAFISLRILSIFFVRFIFEFNMDSQDSIPTFLALFILMSFFSIAKNAHTNSFYKNFPLKYAIYLSIPPIVSLLIISSIFFAITEENRLTSFFSIVTILLFFILNAAVFHLFDRVLEEEGVKRENELLIQQVHFFSEYQAKQEENYKDKIKQQHDLNHRYLYIDGLLSNQQISKARKELASLLNGKSSQYFVPISGNIAIDSVLSSKRSLAENQNISLLYDIEVPVNLPNLDSSLSIILGNALDNAIEAANLTDDKTIRLFIKFIHNNLMIKITNSFSGKLDKRADGTFASKKVNQAQHGFGIPSIYELVKRNNGEISIKIENNVFEMTILLLEKM